MQQRLWGLVDRSAFFLCCIRMQRLAHNNVAEGDSASFKLLACLPHWLFKVARFNLYSHAVENFLVILGNILVILTALLLKLPNILS